MNVLLDEEKYRNINQVILVSVFTAGLNASATHHRSSITPCCTQGRGQYYIQTFL
jgi:hypothetical protein